MTEIKNSDESKNFTRSEFSIVQDDVNNAASKKQEEIAALLNGAGAVMKYQNFDSTARAIFNTCKNLMGATAGYIALLSDEGDENEFLFLESGGLSCSVDPSLPMPIRGLRAEAYAVGKPVYSNDFWQSEWVDLMPEGHVEIHNVLFAPLIVESKAVGLLGIANKPDDFNENDVRLASAFADMVAIALYNNRLLETLKSREEHFRSVAQSAVDAIISIHAQGNIIQWNKAAENIFGYSKEEAKGKPITIIIPKYLHERHQEGIKRLISTGNPTVIGKTVELVGVKKSGEEFPVELSLSRWKTSGKDFFTGIIRDITERKKIQEALENERERLAVTLGSIGDGVIATDTEGKVVLINQVAQKLTGYKQKEAEGKFMSEIFQIINEKTRLPAENPIGKVLEIGKAVGLANHTLLISRDGTEKSIADSCAPIKDRDGSIIGAVLVFRDVTDEKAAEEALSASEMRYRTLFEQSPDGVVLIDPEKTILIDFNEAAHRQLGYSRDEFACLHISDYEVSEKPQETKRRIEKVLRDGKDIFETKHLTKDGNLRDVLVSVKSIKLNDKKILLAIYRDITEKKRAKELSDALNEINSEINSTPDFEKVMKRVVVHAAEAIGAEAASIGIREGRLWNLSYGYGLSHEIIGTKLTDDQARVSSIVYKTKKPLVIDSSRINERVNASILKKLGPRSLLAVPLIIKNEVIGVFTFSQQSSSFPFTETQVDFASKLAASISLAIENTRLYNIERSIANTLQEALIKIPAEISGIDFGSIYRSSTVNIGKVGGDFYDIFELENDSIGVVVGDVSGKGIDAATLTALVKNTIKAYAYRGYSPAIVMAAANNVVRKSTPPEMFATVFFAIIDRKTGQMIYCSAGHPPGILIRKKSDVSFMPIGSPIIGVFQDLEFMDFKRKISKDDVLIIYTDGLTDARKKKEMFGEERLVSLVKHLSNKSAAEIPYHILDVVKNFTNGTFVDDLAIISLSLS